MITSKTPEALAFLAAVDAVAGLAKAGGATATEVATLVAYAWLRLHVDPDTLHAQVMVLGLGVMLKHASEPQQNVTGGKA